MPKLAEKILGLASSDVGSFLSLNKAGTASCSCDPLRPRPAPSQAPSPAGHPTMVANTSGKITQRIAIGGASFAERNAFFPLDHASAGPKHHAFLLPTITCNYGKSPILKVRGDTGGSLFSARARVRGAPRRRFSSPAGPASGTGPPSAAVCPGRA